jgi:hypothetical protein
MDMWRALIPIISTFVLVNLNAQPVLDREYDLITTNQCRQYDPGISIFSKVELDPTIHSISRIDFVGHITSTINAVFTEDEEGFIKMKILFPIDTMPCLATVGFHSIGNATQNPDLAMHLAQNFPTIQRHTPGSQRGQPQICVGLIFFTITNGQVSGVRVANFNFIED